jgi:hypothetical protein
MVSAFSLQKINQIRDNQHCCQYIKAYFNLAVLRKIAHKEEQGKQGYKECSLELEEGPF